MWKSYLSFLEVNMKLVLYHGICSDGFTSALLMYMYFKQENIECQLVPVNYKEPLPTGLDGKDVYILDFCYSPHDMMELAKTAKSITVLDHHLSAAQDYGFYGNHTRIYGDCLVDLRILETESGATLTYQYLLALDTEHKHQYLHNKRLINLIEAVKDYDLWYHKYPDTHYWHELLQMIPRELPAWENLILNTSDDEFNVKFELAKHYFDANQLSAFQFASQFQLINICGYTVPVVNSPHVFADRVCEELNQTYPFAISFIVNSEHLYCSLRSKRDYGADVSEVAKQFGGGGHANSAGFKLHPSNLPKLLSGKLTPKPCLAERILDKVIHYLEHIRFTCCK